MADHKPDRLPRLYLFAFIVFFRVVSSSKIFSDQFVVEVPGGTEEAIQVAKDHEFDYLGKIFENHYHFKHRRLSKRSLTSSTIHHELLSNDNRVQSYSQQIVKKRVKRDLKNHGTDLNDPKWPEMWYLNRGLGLDMNVEEAWAAGATGKGVVVTILDDGLEKDHPDLTQNYDPDASYDINSIDHDPQPRYDFLDSNRHGTRCAGEVAASANNSLCSVGIAYSAKVGGIRMLDGDVTDAVEARSLSHSNQHVDIYSASWGPDDDGKTVDGPGELALKAFQEGILKGRNGKGSIFIWASGNGGREWDNCNCDGYTNSIWTLSISSATEHGLVPWYSEACSSTLAATYSSGSSTEKQVVTTDLHHGCTTTHTGTSASAPLAAGICALALEANNQLTWRDMQHIVVRTAKPVNLLARDWVTNGVNRNVSHSFGYGMMDAGAMVKLARIWVTVPEQKTCETGAHQIDKYIFAKSRAETSLLVNCTNIKYLEHVQARLTVSSHRRGDLHIYLTSPMGTKSTLLTQRPTDASRASFYAWPFMSVHMWGENPNGVWKLEVAYDGRYGGRAILRDWVLTLYGTLKNPDDFIKKRDVFGFDANQNKNSKESSHNRKSLKETSDLHGLPSHEDLSVGIPNALDIDDKRSGTKDEIKIAANSLDKLPPHYSYSGSSTEGIYRETAFLALCLLRILHLLLI